MIHGDVGAAGEFDAVVPVAGRDGSADADTDENLIAGKVEGPPAAFDQELAYRLEILLLVDALQQDREFVAAQARDHVRLSYDGIDPTGKLLQQRVAGRVAERVIHLLEMVQVEVEDRQAFALSEGPKRLLQAKLELTPVDQPGQLVVHGEMLHLGLALAKPERPAAQGRDEQAEGNDEDARDCGEQRCYMREHRRARPEWLQDEVAYGRPGCRLERRRSLGLGAVVLPGKSEFIQQMILLQPLKEVSVQVADGNVQIFLARCLLVLPALRCERLHADDRGMPVHDRNV